MTNTSASGGPLVPTADSPVPIEDDALDAFFQDLVVGIIALPGTLVRPRWQIVPPKEPEPTVDWAAIGITDEEPESNSYTRHHSGDLANPLGYDEQRWHETLTLTTSIYGPNARGNAKLLRDGLWVAQNREKLQLAGMGLVDVMRTPRFVPEQINLQWYRRFDIDFRIRRIIQRFYPVENIVEAGGTIEKVFGTAAGGAEAAEPWDTAAHTN
jgi:hypothetical protein